MKKLFTILLCIAMMLSMVACGGNQDNNESQNTTQNNWVENNETTIAQPTAEEWAAIDQYRDIMQKLDAYAEDGYISVDYADFGIAGDSESIFGNDALAFCYDRLTKLEAIDPWVGTEYVDASWDRLDTLSAFVIVEDVLLSKTSSYADHLGNRNGEWTQVWEYNADGTVFHTGVQDWFDRDAHPWKNRCFLEQVISNPGGVNIGEPFFVYGENGKIEKIEYAYSAGDTINAVRNFTYSGDLISGEQIVFVDGTEQSVSYTYNSNGQVTEITTIEGFVRNRIKYVFEYAYNDRGQVVAEKVTVEQEDYYNEDAYEFYCEAVTEYTYDSNGNLSHGVCAYTEKWDNGKAITTDQWTYTCDDQGRPVSVNMSCGDTIKESGDIAWKVDYPVYDVEFAYGDYYIYNPAK